MKNQKQLNKRPNDLNKTESYKQSKTKAKQQN